MPWTFEDVPNLKGKTVLVTGGNSGLGYEAVKMFVEKEADIIIGARSKEKADEVIKEILTDYPNTKVEFIPLDLSKKTSIKEFATDFLAKYNKLDILLNNAGVMTTPYIKTEQDLEFQQGINHFGHFYLTGLLFKLLKDTPNSRIVNVSSIAHRFGTMNFKDLMYENSKYKKSLAYSRSKLENLLFTYELASRIEEKGYDIKVCVAHPGVAKTDLGRYIRDQKASGKAINFFQKFFSHTAKEGALSLFRACTDTEAKSGDFFGPSKSFGTKGAPHKAKSNKRSHNKKLQKQLWDYSEEKMNFDFIV